MVSYNLFSIFGVSSKVIIAISNKIVGCWYKIVKLIRW